MCLEDKIGVWDVLDQQHPTCLWIFGAERHKHLFQGQTLVKKGQVEFGVPKMMGFLDCPSSKRALPALTQTRGSCTE